MKKIKQKILLGAILFTEQVYAKLPTSAPSQGADKGDYIEMGREFSKSGIELVAQIFGAGLLIAVAAAMVKTFWEIHKGKKEWADLTGVAVGGLAVAVVGIVLLTQAEKIL
ncbi:TIGR03745 family integrating conjugative element membrane protein [Vibrio sp. 1180_3]|uniref:TIGR03745 family integrating conjugative element membrane protein n=1 Tax=Vibrio sp. 1180_3 TaxID=2528832 RepID=UPI002406486C|nr:TIGR03745 family integrating conjugative element membrane protein [Vibrio sp. 1180_3]MDF9399130.1 TIGR03745 family integrating conjugative element membrane protein [Vibrio sp. 1180_3]